MDNRLAGAFGNGLPKDLLRTDAGCWTPLCERAGVVRSWKSGCGVVPTNASCPLPPFWAALSVLEGGGLMIIPSQPPPLAGGEHADEWRSWAAERHDESLGAKHRTAWRSASRPEALPESQRRTATFRPGRSSRCGPGFASRPQRHAQPRQEPAKQSLRDLALVRVALPPGPMCNRRLREPPRHFHHRG